jgi:hypothetical protein
MNRESRYVNAANCSVVQIENNQVLLFGRQLYITDTSDSVIDYGKGKAVFIYQNGRASLNQDPDASVREFETVEVSLNIAFDIFKAFEEIDRENERRLNSIVS